MIEMQWQNETLVLDALRVLYRPASGTLLCADLHLGKTGHFRKEGIAVPQAVFEEDLKRLGWALEKFQPTKLIIVGDLFHSRANEEWQRFATWKKENTSVPFILVKGNHDAGIKNHLEQMDILAADIWEENDWHYRHQPADVLETTDLPLVSGHVHPAVKLPYSTRQNVRLPCFFFSKKQCILPAFSLFTGTHVLQPKATDRVFAITPQAVLPV